MGTIHHIHRSLSKGLRLYNGVIFLGADFVFTDSCSGDSDGFTIVGDQGAIFLISEFDGLMVQTDENDSISLSLRNVACYSLLRVCMFLVHFR